jgi:hypothetical protein
MEPITPAGHQGRSGSDLSWVKSSFSFANGNCVEVASLPGGGVGVRDSKEATGPVLRFTRDEWAAFLGGVHNGEFDRFGKAEGRPVEQDDDFVQDRHADLDPNADEAAPEFDQFG